MIAGVIQQRELFTSMLRREVRARYKGSALGIVWSLVTPLVMLGAYTLVFSVLLKAFQIEHYALFDELAALRGRISGPSTVMLHSPSLAGPWNEVSEYLHRDSFV